MEKLIYNDKLKIITLYHNKEYISITTPSVWNKINKINDFYDNGVCLVDINYKKGHNYEEIVDFSSYLRDLLVPQQKIKSYFKNIDKNIIKVENI